ncbi:GNAT family N-acetyltransferase [Solibacillus sp. CAU 1738]|uniref:GNAT family N-acetyltransferase n=1 Tax=Solibacillus sp. CAU 1738 TaxID=3140363 RepID=UPI0032616BCD
MFEIRYLKDNETSFLMQMLYESIHIEEDKKPPLEQLLHTKELKKYHQNWGRKGDQALVAVVDNKGIQLGAAWYRLFNSAEHGYGYVNDNTPELGIAIRKEARGKGVGTQLMHAIIAEAKKANFEALSLSVDRDNTNAIYLYRKLGFVDFADDETSITMLLK